MTSESIDALVEALTGTDSLAGACESLLESAVEMLGADVAGLLTWAEDGAPERLASTDAAETDLLLAPRGGPAWDAPTPGRGRPGVVTVSDLASDERWPAWGRALTSAGYRSMQIIVLPALAHRPLSLDLYGRRPQQFDAIEQDPAIDAVRLAALLLNRVERVEDLRAALRSRALIAQAQGLFMERFTLTSEQAMAYLRRLSQDQQVKVRDLAQQVVDFSDRGPQDAPRPR